MADKEEEKSEWEDVLVPLDDLEFEGDKKGERDYDNSELVPLDGLELDGGKKEDDNYDNRELVPLEGFDEPKIDSEEYKRKEERERLLQEKEKQEKEARAIQEHNARLAAEKAAEEERRKKQEEAEKRRLEAEKINKKKNGIGKVTIALLLCIALVWGYAVWKNVPTTTSQADNSASPKAQQAAQQAAVARQSAERQYKVGDIIEFGSYPYYENGGEKPIEWQILEKYTDGTALVISKYALDYVKYNETYTNVTWETSSIRKWLNNEFYNKAFRNANKNLMVKSYVENKNNPDNGTNGGNNTYDKLFLLSIDEAKKYFLSDEKRKLWPTPYAKAVNNGRLYTDAEYGGSCLWWLRSPGYGLEQAAEVRYGGNVNSDGFYVDRYYYAVRVAFKINLNNINNKTDKASVVEQTSNKQQTESAENEHRRKAEEAKKKKVERKARKLAVQQAAADKAAARQYKVGDKIYNVGNIITFGSYPFYADGSKKAIDWKILDIDENGDALVISDYALDNVKYNKRNRAITWEESSIRKWLNKTFINKAFTAEQKSKIIESLIENKDNPIENTKGGNATNDKLFLLSIEEVSKYFSNDKERIAYPTPYAKSKESVNGNLLVSSDYGSCWWWLRSPGIYQGGAAGVRSVGEVNSFGSGVASDDIAVRPAFKINLKNL